MDILEKIKPSDNETIPQKIKGLPDEDLQRLLTFVFNQGYGYGHNHTVDGGFTDVHRSELETYHSDIVDDIINER